LCRTLELQAIEAELHNNTVIMASEIKELHRKYGKKFKKFKEKLKNIDDKCE